MPELEETQPFQMLYILSPEIFNLIYLIYQG